VLREEKVPHALALQFDPVTVQCTPTPLLVLDVSVSGCLIVSPARFGVTETAIMVGRGF
jgi:hypothetical protein